MKKGYTTYFLIPGGMKEDINMYIFKQMWLPMVSAKLLCVLLSSLTYCKPEK
jgi:hypothetical protein